MIPDREEEMLARKQAAAGMFSPAQSMALSTGIGMASKGANPEGSVGIGSNVAQGALAGAQFGPEGAAVGAGAGLVVGMLGAAASKKERERKAASEYYTQVSAIEGAKQARLASAIQNMSSQMGSALSQNRSVSL